MGTTPLSFETLTGIRNDAGGSDERPDPGASQATTVNSSASPSSWCRQLRGPSPT